MDEILSKAGSQVVSFAIRSSITLASSYVLKKVSNFVQELPTENREDEVKVKKINRLKRQLENKIIIVSNAIDLIKIVAFNGNNNLNGIIQLTQDIKLEIDSIDDKLNDLQEKNSARNEYDKNKSVLDKVIEYIEDVIERLDEITPFINLSLNTSGINLNSAIPNNISPNLLLNASNLISINNEEYRKDDKDAKKCSLKKIFEFTIYTVFYKIQLKKVVWKEDYNKSQAEIIRYSEKDDEENTYKYNIVFKESFDDDRYHDEEEEEREITINLNNVIKIFYSYSGNLLNLESDFDEPVLILKVDNNGMKKTSTQDIVYYGLGNFNKADNSIKLFEIVTRLLSLQVNEGKDIFDITDEKLALYLNDENKMMNNDNSVDEDETLGKLREVSI
ncbi:hypothetical protein TPHA_0H00570 [Tetrapisispora phaffii CBS 4417]|uniref:Ran-specific GTPase-activating protein 30 n=1 Tax=Tetrapisispora phaffii (strain ATCC 24235 / CBS 4417 / NBRC 1672 / NRRL Y-8282 / UCD 70-5) TaxID=1071381 RepID=G8BWW3_TETPH|nr:hypothetical protein TPHA_0H00570 [Tetrapisispora phaffii CBS 4417]CCE64267.1 hypothetical protein TPHA_0H00570 [Tetrapisispora phaffii CBS 4417]